MHCVTERQQHTLTVSFGCIGDPAMTQPKGRSLASYASLQGARGGEVPSAGTAQQSHER